jgi:uncharacterized metal-binding protein YceD (DUF177 family)
LRQGITATEGERQALARRFELLSLDRLIASVELQRQRNRTILLRAAFEAEFSQECVVTLEPVAGSVAETFALRYGPPEAEPSEEEQADDAAFEPLTSDVIDIGEAVAQELALALPPFPRGPDASVEAEVEDRRDTGPLAGLSRLFEQGSRR